ncbi:MULTISPECIES: S66 peptidase family protein [Rufibacter]|uniref:Muramoyltetrapeptide carboxypeptidase n=1 Tax=Rufibacter quisquiliarum TaxID=1549639 RepID=A0A839GIF8_9BACT|nr:LD-carboxypeptidase [Rufibacter ruber]MBA9076509.1 muramoyltetrapeptide carboxypeptidase [Rufibacter quisquiliarum]
MNLPALQKGDAVGIVCLAKKVSPDEILAGVQLLESWGLRVIIGQSVGAEDRQFGGSDELRTADFQQMLDNPEIKAVISARGGYGTTRILDQIDFSRLQQNPKWVVGFSDITALLCHLQNLGIECLHATMPLLMGQPDTAAADESLRKALFGEPISYTVPAHPLNQLGTATAPVAGGNLILLDTIVNTASDLNYNGKILFLEDVGEYYYNIDRVLVHLRRMGRLSQLAGLVVGQFTEMQDNAVPFGKTVEEIVLEHCAGYGYPICFNFPVGHVPRNLALVVGREAALEVTPEGARLEFL